MNDPVLTCDGHTYERTTITGWLRTHSTSPLTGAELENKNLIPNHLIRSQIRDFLDQQKSSQTPSQPKKEEKGEKESEQVQEESESEEEVEAKVEVVQQIDEGDDLSPIQRALNAGRLSGFSHIQVMKKEKDGADKVIISIPSTITYSVFSRILEFLYTGIATIKDKSDGVTEIIEVAEMYECKELVTICRNILEGNEFLNPSIGTWLNDKAGGVLHDSFVGRDTFADVRLRLDDGPRPIPAHRAALSARSPVIAAMFGGGFKEGQQDEIVISDANYECFMALLEFLYTDHAPIEQSDMMALLVLGNRFALPRLVTLCELYISKAIDVACKDDIARADIDVIGILHTAQEHNAAQLAKFCLHFISTNYQPMSKREEFKLLTGENKKHVEEHQWPPLSYLKELEIYEKAIGGTTKGDDRCLCM